MTHSLQTIERTPTRRLAGALALLVTTGLLGACAMEPGPAYNISQFHRGQDSFPSYSYAHAHDSDYGYNNFPR
jgi:hypothetical protein